MAKKDVIYIDVEDDITAIIDKASKGDADIVALVLPKKTPTLKSSVNMKLLKNSIEKANKKFVLITNESTLLPLAGSAGVHVANNLKSRPTIPKVPEPKPREQVVTDERNEDEALVDASKSVGELDDEAKKSLKPVTKKDGKRKNTSRFKAVGKIKVPDFNKFRLRMIMLIVGLIVGVAGWYIMFRVMPQATIAIQAQTSTISSEITVTLDTAATSVDSEKQIVPAELKEIKKTLTERFTSTGEKDVGKKATGTMTIQNCDSSDPITIPSGTSFTDSNTGFVFVSGAAIEVPGGSFSGGGCSSPGEASVAVTAAEGGDSRNLSPRSYDVSGVGNLISGQGGQMSGGTSEVIKVVTQEDIDLATSTLEKKVDESVRSELTALFDESFIVIDQTFNSSNTKPASNVAVSTEADEGSVSAEFTYTMIGLRESGLAQLLEGDQLSQIDAGALTILDNGVTGARVDINEKISDTQYTLRVAADALVGPEISIDALAEEVAGKRYSEVIEVIKSKPGVRDATVEFSPFWVFSAPSADKTTITIEGSE